VSLDVAEEQGGLLRVSIRVHADLSPAAERGGSAGKAEPAESAPRQTLEWHALAGKAAVKRWYTWSFAASSLAFDHPVVRAVMVGTIGHEHINSLVRWVCLGEGSICGIDGSMTRANLRNRLRALLNMLPHVGASSGRTKGGHVHISPCDGADAPSLSAVPCRDARSARN
jgi:hypothetical protein